MELKKRDFELCEDIWYQQENSFFQAGCRVHCPNMLRQGLSCLTASSSEGWRRGGGGGEQCYVLLQAAPISGTGMKVMVLISVEVYSELHLGYRG